MAIARVAVLTRRWRCARWPGWPTKPAMPRRVCQWAEESLALFRALGHPSGAAGALGLLARQAHDQGDDATALGAYHEALQLWAQTDARWAATRGPVAAQHPPFPRWAGIDDRRLLVQSAGGLAGHCRRSRAMRPGRDAAGRRGSPLGRRGDGGERIAGAPSATRRQRRCGRRWVRSALRRCMTAGHQLGLEEAVALALTISVPVRGRQLPGALLPSPSPTARSRCCACSSRGGPTARSRPHSFSAAARCKTTSPISWPSWASPTGRKQPRSPSATSSSDAVVRDRLPVRCRAPHGNPYPRSPNTVISRFRLAPGGRMLRAVAGTHRKGKEEQHAPGALCACASRGRPSRSVMSGMSCGRRPAHPVAR